MSNKQGRPTKFDELTVKKLEEAFAIGCNDSQACSYSNVSRQAFYNYLKRNPSFVDRMNDLKERPVLKARKTIYDNLNDPRIAQWFLERKQRDEFCLNSMANIPNNEDDGKPLFQVIVSDNAQAESK
jgi:hypothetical protein